jgi:hypothetical protein
VPRVKNVRSETKIFGQTLGVSSLHKRMKNPKNSTVIKLAMCIVNLLLVLSKILHS